MGGRIMFPGFNRAKRGTISNGDWDMDGVRNRKDCEPLNFRKQDAKCSRCGKEMHPLEIFPGNLCVDCYEENYNKEVKKTGVLPRPDFTRTVR